MYGGNPNTKANPYQPRSFNMTPGQRDPSDPYKLGGAQRQAGQMAIQPNAAGLGAGTNTTNPRQFGQPRYPAGSGRTSFSSTENAYNASQQPTGPGMYQQGAALDGFIGQTPINYGTDMGVQGNLYAQAVGTGFTGTYADYLNQLAMDGWYDPLTNMMTDAYFTFAQQQRMAPYQQTRPVNTNPYGY